MPKVRVNRRDTVAEIVLDGPPLNLFDEQMNLDLEAAVDEAGAAIAAGDVRAVLLRAEGKVFCGGVDVHEFQQRSHANAARMMARYLTTVQVIESWPVPTIAAVHGLNLTIGFELSLGCDLLWASPAASFGLVEAAVGLIPGGGGAQRVAARAGIARASELVLTGDIYGAEEMFAWGVVNRIRPAESLLEDVRAYVDKLAAGPTRALGAAKELLLTVRGQGTAAADARTPELAGRPFATQDLADGIASLLKDGPRHAVFHGR
jgi:enoyl-CoA hydratase/carnithine racemase